MAEPFLGEIRIMPFGGTGTYTPRGWAQCNGQLVSIAQNSALYALLGTQYGGDGRTTFALPNLNGRAAVGAGQGPGLSNYPQGTLVGVESVTLQPTQMPAHTHGLGTVSVPVSSDSATATSPAGGVFAKSGSETFGSGTANGAMAANGLTGTATAVGGSQAHDNHMPYLTLNYYIAVQGEFPQRQ